MPVEWRMKPPGRPMASRPAAVHSAWLVVAGGPAIVSTAPRAPASSARPSRRAALHLGEPVGDRITQVVAGAAVPVPGVQAGARAELHGPDGLGREPPCGSRHY